MNLTKTQAKKLEALYRERIKWLKALFVKRTCDYQACGYCDPIDNCGLCPAYDHKTEEECNTNDLDKTRTHIERGMKPFNEKLLKSKVHQHIKTSQRLYRQWRRRYGDLLK